MEKSKIIKKLNFYRYMSLNSLCPIQKKYYADLVRKEEKELMRINREFTLEELSKYNGANGEKAYAAVDGIVYDLSNVAAWGGGTHFGNVAGKDLTSEFKSCHNKDILSDIPIVGYMKKQEV